MFKIHKELPTGVRTSFPEYGGKIEVKYKVRDEFNKPIENEGQYKIIIQSGKR